MTDNFDPVWYPLGGQHGRTGVPTQLLWSSYKTWTRANLRVMLDHYGHHYRPQASKLELMGSLNLLIQERGLTFRDKWRILDADGKKAKPQPRQAKPQLQQANSVEVPFNTNRVAP